MLLLKISDKTSLALASANILTFAGAKSRRLSEKLTYKSVPGATIEENSRLQPGSISTLGSFSYITASNNPSLRLKIGRYCSIGRDVDVLAGRHPIDTVTSSPFFYKPDSFFPQGADAGLRHRGPNKWLPPTYGSVKIGHDVWIGAKSTLKGGITIGNGAVIAGGSVVVKDVEPYAIVGGNPAKVIRYRFDEKLIARLQKLKWWNVSPRLFKDFDMHNVEDFCDRIEALRASKNKIRYTPRTFIVGEDGNISEIASDPDTE